MAAEALTGWGRTAPSVARVERPTSVEELALALRGAPARGAIARGLGRSYGDVAQNAGGVVLDLTGLDEIVGFDRERGEITAQGGCSLAQILELVVPAGWFLPVTPGTRFVTVGGAIACDVHGKNHHRDGSFGQHVSSLTLMTADGELRTLQPPDDEFWATVGGLGLTGVIVEATLRLLKIETRSMRVDVERTTDLDATFERLTATDAGHRYSVAWIDCVAGGRKLGRAVLIQGDHARASEVGREHAAPSLRPAVTAPSWLSLGPVLRGPAIGVLNEVQYRRARTGHGQIQKIAPFFYPLDAVGEWNRVYGRGGFLQYQFVVPLDRSDVVRRTLEELRAAGVRPTLGVLKRFGEPSPAPLSFPAPGWTLALDIALPSAAAPVLDRLDELVADAGGRVYLAKDARLRPDLVPRMLPRLAEWRAVQSRLDPDQHLQHDLARRLRLLA